MCLLYLTANALGQQQDADYFVPQYTGVVVILAALLVYSRTRWFIQTHQSAIGLVCVVVLCTINITPLYNDHYGPNSDAAINDRGFLLANFNIIAIMALFFMMRLQFRVAIVVSVCSIIFLCSMLAVAAGQAERIIMTVIIYNHCSHLTCALID
jgi:VanZ family protein